MTVDTSNPSSPKSLDETLAKAVAHQRAGEFQQAGLLYQTILQADPRHATANHNFGVLAVQMGQIDAGLPYFNAALDADPSNRQFWLSYIDALHKDGQPETARQILALAREHGLAGDEVAALAELLGETSVPPHSKPSPSGETIARPTKTPTRREAGTMVTLFQQGKLEKALNRARRMTREFPDYWLGWKVLGLICDRLGQDAEAFAAMKKAATLAPDDFEIHRNLGVANAALGRNVEAELCYRRALELAPNDIESLRKLALSLHAQCRAYEAVACFERAIEISENDPTAHVTETNGPTAAKQIDNSSATYQQADRIMPNTAHLHATLAGTLFTLRRFAEAETHYRKALEVDPKNAHVLNDLALTLSGMNRLKEANDALQEAIAHQPRYAEAYCHLSSIQFGLELIDEAKSSMKQAMNLRPDLAWIFSNHLFWLTSGRVEAPNGLLAEHRRYDEIFGLPLRSSWRPHINPKDPERRLRIGFVSGDFFNHPVHSYLEPIVAPLSRSSDVSLHAYYSAVINDDVTRRLNGYFSQWTIVANMPDDVLADRIRDDGIDILFDLSGHTARNRLLVFARKPAPLQCSWIGYPGTTGLAAMDYVVSDRFVVPYGHDEQFVEKIVRLPAASLFQPRDNLPPITPLPALANGYLTFGSFNRPSKINRPTISRWSSLLRKLPDSRMIVGTMSEDGIDCLIDYFADEGISRQRLDFHLRGDTGSYLRQLQDVDICLDTFPYSGGSTTLDAISMGVPTLTLAGDTIPTRMSASACGHVGLDDFVANSDLDFRDKGLYWASNVAALAEIRSSLRQRLERSAYSQPALVGKSFERALRIMWRRWCNDLPAESFEIREGDMDPATLAVQP